MKRFYQSAVVLATLAILLSAGACAVYLNDTTVAGRIVDGDSGTAVAGASVRLGHLATLTDADGRFRLAGLGEPQRLLIEAEGYYPLVQPVERIWWRTQSADLRLHPTRLAGVVVDAWTEQPVTGVAVESYPSASSAAQPSQARTDSAGRFVLTRLRLPAEVRFSAPGYLALSSAITGDQVLDGGWQVALTPNTVAGRVYAADTNEPLPDVPVALGGQQASTDQAGRFELHRVAPGATIQVTPPGLFLPAQIQYSGETDLLIRVEPRRLVVAAHDGLMGTPLPGTLVRALEISRTTGSEGAEFSRIPPGTRLELTREGYLTTEVIYQGEARLDVAMRPYAVQGVVRDAATGQPVPGTTLYAGEQMIEADASGFYRIAEIPGEARIEVKAPGYRRASFSPADGSAPHPSSGVETGPCAQDPPTPGSLCLDLALMPFEVRGIYIPFGLLSNPDRIRELLDLIDATELNALVVDVKGDRGFLAYDSQVPLAVELGVSDGREGWLTLEELLAEAEARDIYTVARMVVFKDNPLALGRPELAVQYADGTVWTDGEALGWGNPFREEVWDYNIGIAQEVAALGFDEVQFDYLRFPSDGDIGAIAYAEENTLETRTAAIREFTRRITEALDPYRVFTSADVFGLTVWVEPESDMSIGQRVMDIAPFVDYLCPMVYPATFRSGNLGYANPSAHPYDVIYRSQAAAEERVPPGTRVRPWLQAYWYTLDEMLLQKQAAGEAGAPGWTFWNAGGRYEEALFEPAGEE
jgi:hypothetical protein